MFFDFCYRIMADHQEMNDKYYNAKIDRELLISSSAISFNPGSSEFYLNGKKSY